MSKKKFVDKTWEIYPLDKDLSKKWFVKYRLGGLAIGKWMKANIKNLPSAALREKAATKIIQELEKNGWKPFDKPKVRANADYLKKAFQILETRKGTLSGKSYKTMFSHLKCFNDFCIEQGITSITTAVADRFFDTLMNDGLHPKTVNNYRTTFNSCFNRLVSRKEIRKNPFAETETKKGDSDCPNWFKAHEFEKLEKYMRQEKPFLWAAVRWIFYCLTRPASTLRHLKVGDVDWTRWQIKLKRTNTKNSKSYWVFIPDELRAELEHLKLHEYPSGHYLVGHEGVPSAKQVSEHFWYNHFEEVLQDLEFPSEGYYIYCIKHTGMAHAYLNGADIISLKEHAGHSDIRDTFQYLRRLGLEDNGTIRKNFKKLKP